MSNEWTVENAATGRLALREPTEPNIVFTVGVGGAEVMRIDKRGVTVSSAFPMEEAAKHVINALDTYIKGLLAKSTFTGLPKRKLNELLGTGWHINGVSIEREEGGVTKRGAVTTGGMVLWWHQEQPAPRVVVCHPTGVCDQSGLRAVQPAQPKPLPRILDICDIGKNSLQLVFKNRFDANEYKAAIKDTP